MSSHRYISNCTTLIQIFYYRPDYNSIIQDFSWQYNDFNPGFPRTHKFLNHWHTEIDAVIQEILFAYSDSPYTYRVTGSDFQLDILQKEK